MHRRQGWLMRSAMVCVLLAPLCTRGQRSSGGTSVPDPPTLGNVGGRPGRVTDEMDLGPESALLRLRRDNMRKTQRMEKMSASANRLVELTKQFQADFAAHAVLTPDDVKRLDDIAKVAHELRSRMVE